MPEGIPFHLMQSENFFWNSFQKEVPFRRTHILAKVYKCAFPLKLQRSVYSNGNSASSGTLINPSFSSFGSKIEAEELKKLQLEHKMQRLQNVTEYKVNKSKKTRVSRLITRGAAIECICKDVELLDKAEFFLLAERIFSDQDLRDEITKMVVGRRDRIEAGEAELQSTIEDLKEAGYWKSSRKE